MQFSRYELLVRRLAGQCLAGAVDAPVLVQSRGMSAAIGVPAARLLLDGNAGNATQYDEFESGFTTLAEAARTGEAEARFADTFGFSRPVYHPLLVHLHLAALRTKRSEPTHRRCLSRVGDLISRDVEEADVSHTLWWALCRYDAAKLMEDEAELDSIRHEIQSIVDTPGDQGSLHPRAGLDDLLDAWTYRELVGLHALGRLALLDGQHGWWRRAGEIAEYHQQMTQPDYTTYQPWGVFVFLGEATTTLFGEQQLHDTATQLHIEGGGAGMIPGLILADAAAALGDMARLGLDSVAS